VLLSVNSCDEFDRKEGTVVAVLLEPRPLRSDQARELLAALPSPYDLMARWQLYTGLRVSELLRLEVRDVLA